jgi:branched-chain amino acid transport system ATP-binding protein
VETVPVVRALGICVRFGGVTALAGVDLEVGPGEICGLIGPNGAGKTTLFDTISGVRRPTEGRIELEGVDVTARSATWRARHGLRRTFQRQQPFGWLTVSDNLLVAMEWRGGGGGLVADLVAWPARRRTERSRRQRVDEVIELCRLGDVRDTPAGQLPIGRSRMVELARAIVDPPKVLLLDEPTSGLDETENDRLADVMHRAGCAVVLVEHDMAFVMGHCDRVVVLNLGAVIAAGEPEAVRNEAVVTAAYLG